MELRVLKYFVMVADEGSLTRAAQKLNMSQPPLSTQLKKLEEELGVKLFDRTPQGIILTQAGQFLRNRADSIFNIVNQTERILMEMGSRASNTVSIGCVPTVSEMFLSEWLSDFREKNPHIEINIFEGDTNAIMSLIDSGTVDVGVVRLPIDTQIYNYKAITQDVTYAAVNENHELCKRFTGDTIAFQEILNEKLIMPTRQQSVLPLSDALQNKLDIACRCHSISQGLVMARKEIGISIVPGSARALTFYSTGIRFYKIIDPVFTSTVVMAWRKDVMLTPVMQKFIDKYVSDSE